MDIESIADGTCIAKIGAIAVIIPYMDAYARMGKAL